MKVLITGGAGHIGKVTAARLVRQGWDVRLVDVGAAPDIPGAEYVQCDITHFDDLREQVRGCQAVIHLAALPTPGMAPVYRLFEINVGGTFNVFEAAAEEGIRRVVQASSINALGCSYNILDMRLQYFPIDEAHPSFTNDPYAFSKEMIENISSYFWRRDGISGVAMRFPWVYPEGYLQSEGYAHRRQRNLKLLSELAALPEQERQSRIAEMRQQVLDYRIQRPQEFRNGQRPGLFDHRGEDPLWIACATERFNFWAFVDVRDAAQALEKAVTAQYEGSHALFITDDHNSLNTDSATLVRYFYPEIEPAKINLTGSTSLLSIEKARALIGFEPEYSVSKLGQTPEKSS